MSFIFDDHVNFARSTVLTAPTPALSGTTLVLAAGGGALLPAAPFNCTVVPPPGNGAAEIVRVTAVVGDTLTIIRAQEGTAAIAIALADLFGVTITAKALQDIEAAVNTVEASLITKPTVVAAPVTPTDAATHPSIAVSGFYLYYTIANNTWRRTAGGTW